MSAQQANNKADLQTMCRLSASAKVQRVVPLSDASSLNNPSTQLPPSSTSKLSQHNQDMMSSRRHLASQCDRPAAPSIISLSKLASYMPQNSARNSTSPNLSILTTATNNNYNAANGLYRIQSQQNRTNKTNLPISSHNNNDRSKSQQQILIQTPSLYNNILQNQGLPKLAQTTSNQHKLENSDSSNHTITGSYANSNNQLAHSNHTIVAAVNSGSVQSQQHPRRTCSTTATILQSNTKEQQQQQQKSNRVSDANELEEAESNLSQESQSDLRQKSSSLRELQLQQYQQQQQQIQPQQHQQANNSSASKRELAECVDGNNNMTPVSSNNKLQLNHIKHNQQQERKGNDLRIKQTSSIVRNNSNNNHSSKQHNGSDKQKSLSTEANFMLTEQFSNDNFDSAAVASATTTINVSSNLSDNLNLNTNFITGNVVGHGYATTGTNLLYNHHSQLDAQFSDERQLSDLNNHNDQNNLFNNNNHSTISDISNPVSAFAHYNQSNSKTNNLQQTHLTSSMLEKHMLEAGNKTSLMPNSANNNGSLIASSRDVGHLDSLTARELVQHQARTSINQYYTSHYNLMPTSSKSSSPKSSNSTPSPRMNSLVNQQTTNHHLNTMASSSIHLDQLNQQYINAAASANHNQQHSQQYVNYNNHGSNSTINQHHLPPNDHIQQPQLQQQHHLQQSLPNQQAIYQHLANNAPNVNHLYGGNASGTSGYQNQIHGSGASHQNSQLMGSSHHNHSLNSAAAACAAAVAAQTLKTVANQHHHQQTSYGHQNNNLGTSSNNIMNMTTTSHNPFAAPNSHSINHQHLTYQHQPNHQLQHASNIVARKYQCKMCPQVFMSKAEMKYHNQNHMREAKPYKCLQCPKAFANSSYLSQHMRIHQGVKPYTCELCARKFTQLSHLQQHKRTHTGDKPYKCNYVNCTKQFSQLSNLQSHSRCHQLDKPYKCNSCYKCFNDEQSLLEHIPRHLESKHLKKNLCIFCGSSYQQERGLVKHFQQYHTEKSPTLVAAAIAAGTTGNTTLIASLVSTSNGCSSNSSISSTGSSIVNANNNSTLTLNLNNY